ncbi:MAG TPA: hypothetical protein VJN71_05580 [Nitrososphaerales archaeon]|nr:hypothetical protein [Nitrososphaerales archaeon]
MALKKRAIAKIVILALALIPFLIGLLVGISLASSSNLKNNSSAGNISIMEVVTFRGERTFQFVVNGSCTYLADPTGFVNITGTVTAFIFPTSRGYFNGTIMITTIFLVNTTSTTSYVTSNSVTVSTSC